jgi:DNA-binding response OmpR family regulator
LIQSQRLLVIDDDPVMRKVLTLLLHKDFFVTVQSSGKEGVAFAWANRPDAVVLDMHMPGWDGVETLSAIRQHPALCDIPVLILSSDDADEQIVRAKEFGADDYLVKTSQLRELLVPRLKALLRSARIRDGVPQLQISTAVAPNGSGPPGGTSRFSTPQSILRDFEDGF